MSQGKDQCHVPKEELVEHLREDELRVGPYTLKNLTSTSAWLEKNGGDGMEIADIKLRQAFEKMFDELWKDL